MKNKIIIANSILLSDDRMLRLGVVETDDSGLLTYEDHYAEVYARVDALLSEEKEGNPNLLATVELVLGVAGAEADIDSMVNLIMESDQMIYFLSDLRKNWNKLSETEITVMNEAAKSEIWQADGINQGNIRQAKEYLKEYDLFSFLESLSMYLDT